MPCSCTEATGEVLRGIRNHFPEYVDKLTDADLRKAQLGLGHSYSRAKVRNVGWVAHLTEMDTQDLVKEDSLLPVCFLHSATLILAYVLPISFLFLHLSCLDFSYFTSNNSL